MTEDDGIRWNRVWTGAAVLAGAVLLGLAFTWASSAVPAWLVSIVGPDLPDFGPLLGTLIIYFLPTLIAYGRRNRQALAIGALNLLLGWTVLGWIGALIWALIVDRPRAAD